MRISDWSSDVCSSDLVHRFLLQPDGGEEFQRSVTQQVDRADFRPKRLGDDLHDAVELGLRRGARGHDIMQTRQYFAGGGGGCLLHEHELADYRPSVKRSEEHTSELQSLMRISYAVFCLKKKKNPNLYNDNQNQSIPYLHSHTIV